MCKWPMKYKLMGKTIYVKDQNRQVNRQKLEESFYDNIISHNNALKVTLVSECPAF